MSEQYISNSELVYFILFNLKASKVPNGVVIVPDASTKKSVVFVILIRAVSALLAKPLDNVATVEGGRAKLRSEPVITLSIIKIGPSDILRL